MLHRFDYVETEANKEDLPLKNLIFDSVQILRNDVEIKRESRCLESFCESGNADQSCPYLNQFDIYMRDVQINFDAKIIEFVQSKLPNQWRFDSSLVDATNQTVDNGCRQMVADFLLLQQMEELLAGNVEEAHPGTILKWVYDKTRTEDKGSLYDKYLIKYPFAYSQILGDISGQEQLPAMINGLTLSDSVGNTGSGPIYTDIPFSPSLQKVMQHSMGLPELIQHPNAQSLNPMFPFCIYNNDKADEGIRVGPYGESYCKSFMPTINDRGQCYTYNNVNLHGDELYKDFGIRTVQGCGKSKGLRLALDTHKLYEKSKGRQDGFMVYVTVNGVITHKVPFKVTLPFHGEYSFYLHGLHFIASSPRFTDWNSEYQVIIRSFQKSSLQSLCYSYRFVLFRNCPQSTSHTTTSFTPKTTACWSADCLK